MISIEMLIAILVPAFGGMSAAIGVLYRRQEAAGTEAIAWREERIAELIAKVTSLELREAALEKRIVEVERENIRLKTQWMVYASSHDSSPLPQWIKDRNGVVLAANKAYERHFLVPRGYKLTDYVGYTDASVWPAHIADQFGNHDQAVLDSESNFDGEELCTNAQGIDVPIRVIKYARYVTGIDQPFGVAGIAVPTEL